VGRRVGRVVALLGGSAETVPTLCEAPNSAGRVTVGRRPARSHLWRRRSKKVLLRCTYWCFLSTIAAVAVKRRPPPQSTAPTTASAPATDTDHLITPPSPLVLPLASAPTGTPAPTATWRRPADEDPTPGSPAFTPEAAAPAEREEVYESGAASQQQRAHEAVFFMDLQTSAHAPHNGTHALRR